MSVKILHRDDLMLGGFAGLKEHRLVVEPRLFGEGVEEGSWPGIGNFVYLADARFDPKGETMLHNHREVDVISVIVEGRIDHEGSLENGTGLKTNDVQVQRAGGEGFSHNEINPDDEKNRMIQIWVLPEHAGEKADYRLYKPKEGAVTRVYGGGEDRKDTFSARTTVDVARLNPGEEFDSAEPFMAYVTGGRGTLGGGEEVSDGDLMRGDYLHFSAETGCELIVIRA